MHRPLAATALLLALGQAHALTTLTFEGDICAGNSVGTGALVACIDGAYLNQAYGDAVGVDVSFLNQTDGTSSMSFWSGDYSGLTRVAYGGVDPQVTLAATAGYQIQLHGFALGAWPNVNRTSQYTVTDLATNTVILSSGSITVFGNAPTQVSFANAVSSVGFRIAFGPDGFNVGIDNIAFTVSAVPEPANAALLAAGLLALGALQRRRGR